MEDVRLFTVKQLIKKLSKFNPHAEVVFVVDGFDETKKNWLGIGGLIDEMDYDDDDPQKCSKIELYSSEISQRVTDISQGGEVA